MSGNSLESRGRLGTLIYEEPAAHFIRRYRSYGATAATFGGLAAATVYVVLLSPVSNPVPSAFCLVGPIVLVTGLVATAALVARRLAAPFRVHALGVSLGNDLEDRVLFRDVAHVETWSRVDGIEYLMLTLCSGRTITITGSPLAKNVSLRLLDYERAKRALLSQYEIGGSHDVAWESTAKELVGDLEHFKGPVRAAAERIARKLNRKTVDLRFIIDHAEEIRKEAWPYGRELGERIVRVESHAPSARA